VKKVIDEVEDDTNAIEEEEFDNDPNEDTD
jgi:hypothetical protein